LQQRTGLGVPESIIEMMFDESTDFRVGSSVVKKRVSRMRL
jgi:hypothetical protein